MGRDGIVDLERIARTIREADVVCLQEVERHWRSMPHADQVVRLIELLPEHHGVFAASVDLHQRGATSDAAGRLARRQYGNLTLSRWPVLSTRTFPLAKLPVHGHVNDQSCLLEAVIAPADRPIRVYNTHLNYLSQRQRLLQTQELLRIIVEAPRQGGPVAAPGAPDSEFGADWMVLERHELTSMPAPALLMGDFNMRTNSPEYEAIVGPADPFYGRLAETTLFADALTLTGLAEDQGTTHPDADPSGRKRIDHIFVSGDLAGRVKRAWIDDDADGSDHQPVFAELDW
jgi:endonuclease/exonuclease/phosphatase family metal-dependent hydrolase